MAERRRRDERESTYRWVNSLPQLIDRYEAIIKALEAHHNHAENLQPVSRGAVPVTIAELLEGARRIQQEVNTWYGTARTVMRRDMERVDDPIGGSAERERRGDVGYNMRDI